MCIELCWSYDHIPIFLIYGFKSFMDIFLIKNTSTRNWFKWNVKQCWSLKGGCCVCSVCVDSVCYIYVYLYWFLIFGTITKEVVVLFITCVNLSSKYTINCLQTLRYQLNGLYLPYLFSNPSFILDKRNGQINEV